ncbi:MAG: oligosaccharide flippase family protein [Myxococcota bacterium]|nr:oligosaccharide flippase family protein [Myxococcota bacterium]
MSLGRRVFRGSAILSAGSWLAQAVNLVIALVIARVLGPADFGLYAFCFAINEFLNIVGAFSLQHALIQSRDASQELYDTAFAIYAGLGGLAVLLAAAIAPFLWHARSPEAAWILLVMALANAARLLAQIPQARLERSLRYGAVTVSNTVAAVVPNVLAVGLAWGGLGVWSLAIRDALVGLSWLALSVWLAGYRFQARLTREAWSRLMDFSRPLFVARSLEIVMERLDAAAVGAFLGSRAAGLYHWARSLAELGFVGSRPLERVSLNLYARLQDDPQRLARSVGLVNAVLVRVLLAGSAVLLVFPAETVRLLLGKEWLGVAPVLRWLALYGTLLPLLHNVKMLLYARDRVRRVVRARMVQALVFGAFVAVGIALESLTWIAGGLLASTALALSLCVASCRDLVAVPLGPLAATPAIALAATTLLFLGLGGVAFAEAWPWYLRPAAPALVYVALTFAAEPRRLLADLRYFASQTRG